MWFNLTGFEQAPSEHADRPSCNWNMVFQAAGNRRRIKPAAGHTLPGPLTFAWTILAVYLLPPPVPPLLPVLLLPLPPLMLPELIPDEPLPPEPLAPLDPLEPPELFPDEPPLWDLCLLLSSVALAAALPVLPEEPLEPEFESLAAGMLLDVPEPVVGPEVELCASATPVLSAHTSDAIISLFIYFLHDWTGKRFGSAIEMHELCNQLP